MSVKIIIGVAIGAIIIKELYFTHSKNYFEEIEKKEQPNLNKFYVPIGYGALTGSMIAGSYYISDKIKNQQILNRRIEKLKNPYVL